MKPLYIEATRETPQVILDKDLGKFSFTGISFSENPNAYYKPILEWVTSYMDNPNSITTVDFKFQYFNTSSKKQIAKILFQLECIASNSKVMINWHYKEGDAIMKQEGLDFKDIFRLDINLVQY